MSLSVLNGANGNKLYRAACFLTLIGVVGIAFSSVCTRESFLLKKEMKTGNDSSLVSNQSTYLNQVYDKKERGPEFYRYINDTRIKNRHLYLMNATDSADLRFCKIPFGKLNWKPKNQYHDLLADCNMKGEPVHLSDFIAPAAKKKVTIMHEVTKTGSTSVRIQIFHRLSQTCSNSPEAKLYRPGYHFCRSIPEMAKNCPEEESFVFGHFPDADYSHLCFDYSPWGIEEDRQFLHTIAFREFYNWAESALNQVIKNDLRKHPNVTVHELCGNLRSRFQPAKKCTQGMGETNFAKYSKSTLRTVLRESPESHIALLHHYKDTTLLQTRFREQIGLAPLDMSKRRNTDHTNLTCADDVLESYHACFDHFF